MNLDEIENLSLEQVEELYDDILIADYQCWCRTRTFNSSCNCYNVGGSHQMDCRISTSTISSRAECKQYCTSNCGSGCYWLYMPCGPGQGDSCFPSQYFCVRN